MRRTTGKGAAAAAFVLLAMAPAAAAEISAERRSQLGYLVVQDCGSCHGMTLNGGLGKPLRPADLEGLEAEAIADMILDGVPGTPMPPWRGLIARHEAEWIAEALKKGLIK
jgi:cytochrome c55X